MRRPALVTTLFATPALLQEQPGGSFAIGNIKGEGSGCPTDTWQLFVEEGGFAFTSFNATIGVEDEAPALGCTLSIELNDVTEGYRITVSQIDVSGKSGLDTGVQATVSTSTSWTGEEGSKMSEDQVLLGSAVGIEFPLDFQAGGTFAGQASKCGDPAVELNIHVDVSLERDADAEEAQGELSVAFARLRIDIEECEAEAEEPVEEEPAEEEPVEETPAEEEDPVEEDECVVDGEEEAPPAEEEPVEEAPEDECVVEEDPVEEVPEDECATEEEGEAAEEPAEPAEPEAPVEEEPVEEEPVEEEPVEEEPVEEEPVEEAPVEGEHNHGL